MKNIILVAVAVLSVPVWGNSSPMPEDKDLTQWAQEQAETLPETIDGVHVYRPEMADGMAVVSDLIDLPDLNQTSVFVNSIVYVVDNLVRDEEAISAADFEGRKFVVEKVFFNEQKGKDEASYKCQLAIQATDNMLSFSVSGIEVSYKEKGILPRTLKYEKLNLVDNKRHKELSEEFSFLCSKYLKDLTEYVKTAQAPAVTHWKEISSGQVAEGMNEAEVKMVKGRARNVRKSGGRIKWMYDDESVIIFQNGTVFRVIE